MAKIYTKTGDRGETGLLGGKRIAKNHPQIEAYGAIDELNALLGVIRSFQLTDRTDKLIKQIQEHLFALALTFTAKQSKIKLPAIAYKDTKFLEDHIDFYDAKLPPLRNFILPAGTKTATLFHLARTVCRRAERTVVAFERKHAKLPSPILPYLNRLSDLLFVLARFENFKTKKKETPWKGVARRDGFYGP